MDTILTKTGKLIPNPKTKEDIIELLKDQVYLERAVCAIYERQTAEEKAIGETIKDNGVGFAGKSRKASYVATYILKGVKEYEKPYGKNLSGKWLEWARKTMPRYASQLLRYSKVKIAAIQAESLTKF